MTIAVRHYILLVEDSKLQADHLSTHLRHHGLTVDVCGLGRDALAYARINPPAAVVLDVELPDINGHDLCRTLKADPATAHVPIVMLTSRSTHQDTLDGLNNGAVDYIAKDAFAPNNLLLSLCSLGVCSLTLDQSR